MIKVSYARDDIQHDLALCYILQPTMHLVPYSQSQARCGDWQMIAKSMELRNTMANDLCSPFAGTAFRLAFAAAFNGAACG